MKLELFSGDTYHFFGFYYLFLFFPKRPCCNWKNFYFCYKKLAIRNWGLRWQKMQKLLKIWKDESWKDCVAWWFLTITPKFNEILDALGKKDKAPNSFWHRFSDITWATLAKRWNKVFWDTTILVYDGRKIRQLDWNSC